MEHQLAAGWLGRLLDWARDQRALYVHGQAGRAFRVRVNGRLETVPAEICPAAPPDQLMTALREFFDGEICDRIEREAETNLIFHFNHRRYRGHFGREQGRLYFSFRAVPPQTFRLKDLQLPASLRDLLLNPAGLVLFAGPPGQGKGNSARALLQEINESLALRVITVEEPVKYVFAENQAQILQREVGIDVDSVAAGLRSALRENPDVIFLNEISDRDTLDLALGGAEQGMLVIAVASGEDLPEALRRLREKYPEHEQKAFDARLARCLNAVCFQRQVPNVSQGRTPCVELLRHSPAVAEAIRRQEFARLPEILRRSVAEGMHTHDQYLVELLAAGVITANVAREYAISRETIETALNEARTPAGVGAN